jgi:hypothetical protein
VVSGTDLDTDLLGAILYQRYTTISFASLGSSRLLIELWEVARRPRRLLTDDYFRPVVPKIDLHSSGVGALRMADNALRVLSGHTLLIDLAASRGNSGKQSSGFLYILLYFSYSGGAAGAC